MYLKYKDEKLVKLFGHKMFFFSWKYVHITLKSTEFVQNQTYHSK